MSRGDGRDDVRPAGGRAGPLRCPGPGRVPPPRRSSPARSDERPDGGDPTSGLHQPACRHTASRSRQACRNRTSDPHPQACRHTACRNPTSDPHPQACRHTACRTRRRPAPAGLSPYGLPDRGLPERRLVTRGLSPHGLPDDVDAPRLASRNPTSDPHPQACRRGLPGLPTSARRLAGPSLGRPDRRRGLPAAVPPARAAAAGGGRPRRSAAGLGPCPKGALTSQPILSEIWCGHDKGHPKVAFV